MRQRQPSSDLKLFIDPFARVKLQPTQGNLFIRPGGHDIGPRSQDHVKVIGEDGVGQAIDTEDRGHLFEPRTDPLSAVEVVLAGHVIDAGQEGSAYASLNAVDDADFVGIEDLSTFGSGHSTSPFRLNLSPTVPPVNTQGGWHRFLFYSKSKPGM